MILEGDCRTVLAGLPERSVQTCVTSPPFFGLRDYGTGEWEGGDPTHGHHGTHGAGGGSSKNGADRPGMGGREHVNGAPNRGGDPSRCPCGARRVDRQIGLEPTPDEFVAALVAVFREVRRVLRDDGTVWLNLGDSYSGAPVGSFNGGGFKDKSAQTGGRDLSGHAQAGPANKANLPGIKPKDLIGIPWMVAFALRADGWYLRSDIIWNKPNPMPESVTDRPTKAHEYLFLLSKGPRYWYDADAVREDSAPSTVERADAGYAHGGGAGTLASYRGERVFEANGRNKRSVWTVATAPFAGAHFATFPPKLIEPCILAGSPPKCCGACGAPWRRVVERTPRVSWEERKAAGAGRGNVAFNGNVGAGTQRGVHGDGVSNDLSTEVRTVGWESTCTHQDDTGSSVILDPFAGSGTVGVVCGWHARKHVGIELNPEYAEMARARIALEGRPGGRPAHHEPAAVVAEQLGLL